MPRPHPSEPKDGQMDLIEYEAVKKVGEIIRGRHSIAVDAALAAAAEQGYTDEVDKALLTTIRAGAWALDSFELQNKPYGPSKTIEPMLAAIREAGLTPEVRAAHTNDNVDVLLENLMAADDPSPATVS